MGNQEKVISYSEAQELQRRIRCFMDGIDWQYHLKGDDYGTKLFPSLESIKEHVDHLKDGQCGIVEVEVRLIRWVEPQSLGHKT
jgi:hypothetical protein